MFQRVVKEILKTVFSMGMVGGFVWLVTLLKVITGNVTIFSEIADWVILVGGGFMLLGSLSAWANGRGLDEFKK